LAECTDGWQYCPQAIGRLRTQAASREYYAKKYATETADSDGSGAARSLLNACMRTSLRRIIPVVLLLPCVAFAQAGVTGLTGCSSSPVDAPPYADGSPQGFRPLKFHKETLRVPKSFSDTVRVTDSAIIVPHTPENLVTLAKIAGYKTIAGDRDRTHDSDYENSPNPLGFIVAVTKMEERTEAGRTETIISTLPGRMKDLIREGSIRLAEDEPNIFDLDDEGKVIPGSPSAIRLRTLTEGTRSDGLQIRSSTLLNPLASGTKSDFYDSKATEKSGKWSPEAKTASDQVGAEATLVAPKFECAYRINPSIENSRIDYETSTYKAPILDPSINPEFGIGNVIGEEEITRESLSFARLVVSVNPSITCDVTMGVKFAVKKESYARATLTKQFSTPRLVFPILGVPIPMQIEIGLGVGMGIQAKGEVELTFREEIKGRIAVGGSWQRKPRLFTNLSERTSSSKVELVDYKLTSAVAAELKAGPTIVLTLGLARTFGIGLKAEGGLQASVSASACKNKTSTAITGAVTPEWFTQLDLIASYPPSQTYPLVNFGEWKLPIESGKKMIGQDPKVCDAPDKEDCSNKPNGFYCSANKSDYAYECRSKTYVTGILCPNSGFSSCGAGEGNRAALDNRGNLVCK
jgi:hypothetical protein